MTELGPEREPAAAAPGTGLGAVSTDEELRDAVLALLGTSYDRAVESRTGLSKTTVNDLRNGRRRLTLKTLTLIVETYDPTRRDAWLDAWHRLHPRAVPRVPRLADPPARPAGPGSRPPAVANPEALDRGEPDDPADYPAPLDRPQRAEGPDPADDPSRADGPDPAGDPQRVGRPTHAASASRPAAPGLPWRTVWLPAGAAFVAAVAAVVAAVLVLTSGDSAVDPELGSGPPPPGPVGAAGLPPYGPGGPGAAAPVGGPGPPPAIGARPAADAETSVPGGCYSLPLPTRVDVIDGQGTETTGIRLTAASYSYFAAWNPSAAVGGRLSGQPAAGRRFVGAAWADPATTDSTPAHHPGNGRFYPGEVLELTDQNCFTVQPYNIGYGGYSGITTRIYVLSIDASDTLVLPREAHQRAGLTEEDLARHGVDVLGYFAVPSPAWSGG